MMTDEGQPGPAENGAGPRPNASAELQDAIRSIDAIGENAWGKDDDEDLPRQDDSPQHGAAAGGDAPAATDPSVQDRPEGDPDAR